MLKPGGISYTGLQINGFRNAWWDKLPGLSFVKPSSTYLNSDFVTISLMKNNKKLFSFVVSFAFRDQWIFTVFVPSIFISIFTVLKMLLIKRHKGITFNFHSKLLNETTCTCI